MSFYDFIGICVALGFFIVFLDMRASARLFRVMRKDIDILHSRIVALERGTEKSD